MKGKKERQFIRDCYLCGGELKSTDNPKTPKGLFTCQSCTSLFRLSDRGNLMLVTNNTWKQKLKEQKLEEEKKKKAK